MWYSTYNRTVFKIYKKQAFKLRVSERWILHFNLRGYRLEWKRYSGVAYIVLIWGITKPLQKIKFFAIHAYSSEL